MERYDNLYQPGILAERNTPAWYQNVRKNDLSTGFLWNASSAQLGNYPDRYTVSAAMSYVTGAHNVKVGMLNGWGHVPPLQQRQRRPLPDLHRRRADPGDGAEHPARGPGEHGRPARRLRPGLVAVAQLHLQLRRPLRPRRPEHRRPGRPVRPLHRHAGLRRLRGADVERLLAAHLGRLGHLRQRQDGGPHRLQPVHDRADHRVRAALRADGADHPEPAVDRRQRRRHRPGRAWLHAT